MSRVETPTLAMQGRPNARVYSLNEGDIVVGPFTLVSGQLFVFNRPTYTLLDLGATLS